MNNKQNELKIRLHELTEMETELEGLNEMMDWQQIRSLYDKTTESFDTNSREWGEFLFKWSRDNPNPYRNEMDQADDNWRETYTNKQKMEYARTSNIYMSWMEIQKLTAANEYRWSIMFKESKRIQSMKERLLLDWDENTEFELVAESGYHIYRLIDVTCDDFDFLSKAEIKERELQLEQLKHQQKELIDSLGNRQLACQLEELFLLDEYVCFS